MVYSAFYLTFPATSLPDSRNDTEDREWILLILTESITLITLLTLNILLSPKQSHLLFTYLSE